METTLNERLLNCVKQVKALADAGLVYAADDYDRDRYESLQQLSYEMMGLLSGQPIGRIGDFFNKEKDYPTPKVDVRGVVLNDREEILLVKETADGRWSLPGGWGEIGFSPTEAIRKEIREETGLEADVVRLLAVYDKKCHPYPPQPFYVYKLVFLCSAEGTLDPCFEIDEAGWFPVDRLPPVSEDRILPDQIRELHRAALTPGALPVLD